LYLERYPGFKGDQNLENFLIQFLRKRGGEFQGFLRNSWCYMVKQMKPDLMKRILLLLESIRAGIMSKFAWNMICTILSKKGKNNTKVIELKFLASKTDFSLR